MPEDFTILPWLIGLAAHDGHGNLTCIDHNRPITTCAICAPSAEKRYTAYKEEHERTRPYRADQMDP